MAAPANLQQYLEVLSEEPVDPPLLVVTRKTRLYLGRHVFGFAAIGFGIISLVWHDLGGPWQQTQALGNFSHHQLLVYLVAALEIFGGIAIQWPRTERIGALALWLNYLTFALLWVPRILAEPLIYDHWGNFFEQFSLVSGALIIWATAGRRSQPATKVARSGYLCFGICMVSFTLEQFFYLSPTAQFVPKWIPPGQMFWAVTTTIAFALAAVALLTGKLALLAARLTTAMIAGFGLLVWLPRLFADPHSLMSWAGNAQNLAIAGAACVVAEFLERKQILET